MSEKSFIDLPNDPSETAPDVDAAFDEIAAEQPDLADVIG